MMDVLMHIMHIPTHLLTVANIRPNNAVHFQIIQLLKQLGQSIMVKADTSLTLEHCIATFFSKLNRLIYVYVIKKMMKSTLSTNSPTFTFSPNTTCVLPIKSSATLSSLDLKENQISKQAIASQKPSEMLAFEMLHLEADHKSCGFPLQHLPSKPNRRSIQKKKL